MHIYKVNFQCNLLQVQLQH